MPQEFHPNLLVGTRWLERGQNLDKERRAELRKVAYARIEALQRKAEHAIEEYSVEMRTQILSTGMYSEEAKALLAAMPQPRDLMPALDIDELERAVPLAPKTPDRHDAFRYTRDVSDTHER